jgi:hypothetical protein
LGRTLTLTLSRRTGEGIRSPLPRRVGARIKGRGCRLPST